MSTRISTPVLSRGWPPIRFCSGSPIVCPYFERKFRRWCQNLLHFVKVFRKSGCGRAWLKLTPPPVFLKISWLISCSFGASVGAIYASGSLQSLKDFVLKMDGKKIFSYFDVVFPRSGLLNGSKKLKELFTMHTDAKKFSDLNIPVLMVATDLETGVRAVLKTGYLLDALNASMSIPGLFEPASVKGRWLVDGGLLDPVPVSVAKATGADVVIAVDLNSRVYSYNRLKKNENTENTHPADEQPASNEFVKKLTTYYETAELSLKNKIDEFVKREPSPPPILETVMTAIGIMQERITRINLAVDPPEILIQPQLGELKMMDFDHVGHTIEEGYAGIKKQIGEIKRLLEMA